MLKQNDVLQQNIAFLRDTFKIWNFDKTHTF